MYGLGWLDYIARVEGEMARYRTNTADDRKRRKERARMLTRKREAELAVKKLHKACDGHCEEGGWR